MNVFQKVALKPGEQAHVTTPERKAIVLHCVSGSADVLTQACGFRWRIQSGERFLLRCGAIYKIRAASALEVSIDPFDIDLQQPVRGDK